MPLPEFFDESERIEHRPRVLLRHARRIALHALNRPVAKPLAAGSIPSDVANHPMRILSPREAKTWGVLDPQDAAVLPMIRGGGTEDYQCGKCNVTLLEHLPENMQIQNMAVKCPACTSINAFEPI
jgi:hypothetical protein